MKKFDRSQFDSFCTSIYTEGFADGEKSVKGVEVGEVLDAIHTVKGIGEKRMEQIKQAVEAVFCKTEAHRADSKGVCEDG